MRRAVAISVVLCILASVAAFIWGAMMSLTHCHESEGARWLEAAKIMGVVSVLSAIAVAGDWLSQRKNVQVFGCPGTPEAAVWAPRCIRRRRTGRNTRCCAKCGQPIAGPGMTLVGGVGICHSECAYDSH